MKVMSLVVFGVLMPQTLGSMMAPSGSGMSEGSGCAEMERVDSELGEANVRKVSTVDTNALLLVDAFARLEPNSQTIVKLECDDGTVDVTLIYRQPFLQVQEYDYCISSSSRMAKERTGKRLETLFTHRICFG